MEQLALIGPGTDGTYICPACGTLSPNEYVHKLNHHIGAGRGDRYCVTQWNAIAHVAAARKYPEFAGQLDASLARAHELGLTEEDLVLA
ncbi:hypothetical protein EJK80_06215 [Corynebacterium phoceense]|uniref:Uncharacterized protein n=1 Tax=Corynebacterium phoceense TaxID=1686286 RepID=A0A540R782_9CORY|nr:hypothetical protein [Corynebacterium phoceense]TQE43600.1 hypothetical protein EJK80_06215 [Corynebacterium phoceense]